MKDNSHVVVMKMDELLTEIFFVVRGEVAAQSSTRVGRTDVGEAVTDYFRGVYRLAIGPRQAEELVNNFTAPAKRRRDTNVTGRDLGDGKKRKMTVSRAEIQKAVHVALSPLVALLRRKVIKGETPTSKTMIFLTSETAPDFEVCVSKILSEATGDKFVLLPVFPPTPASRPFPLSA